MSTPVEDVVELRKQRKSETLREFEQRRDWAEYNAALTAWQQSDIMRCRQSLKRLLARNPEHAEAQDLLAELDQKSDVPVQSTASVQLASFDSPPHPTLPPENAAEDTNIPSSCGSAKLAQRAEVNGNAALARAAGLLAEGEEALVGGHSKRSANSHPGGCFRAAIQPRGRGPRYHQARLISFPRLRRATPHYGCCLLPVRGLQIFPSCAATSTFVGQHECPDVLFTGLYVVEAWGIRGGPGALAPSRYT